MSYNQLLKEQKNKRFNTPSTNQNKTINNIRKSSERDTKEIRTNLLSDISDVVVHMCVKKFEQNLKKHNEEIESKVKSLEDAIDQIKGLTNVSKINENEASNKSSLIDEIQKEISQFVESQIKVLKSEFESIKTKKPENIIKDKKEDRKDRRRGSY